MERIVEGEFDTEWIDHDMIVPVGASERPIECSRRVQLVPTRTGGSAPLARGTAALPSWLSPLEVAEVLKLDRHTVYRLLRDGELPGTKIGGRWFVGAEALATRISGSS